MKDECWLISYDIADPKRLRNVARIMERYGTRVQKSVFECWLAEQDRLRLLQALEPILKAPPDTVRFYPLCADCRKKAYEKTNTKIEEITPYYIV